MWYSASFTIAAGWLKQGGKVGYSTYAQPPDDVRSQLSRLGLRVEELEKDDLRRKRPSRTHMINKAILMKSTTIIGPRVCGSRIAMIDIGTIAPKYSANRK